MRTITTSLLLILILVLAPALQGQDKPPVTDYVPPESLISLNSSLEIGTALDMLSEYAIRFAGKPIYDPTKQDGMINIEVTSMPWEKALQTILARRGLWYEQQEHFYQVIVPAPASDELGGGNSAFGEAIRYKPGSKEVKIETIFFEGDRKVLNEMGIDWSTFRNGKVDISSAFKGEASQTGGLAFGIDIPQRFARVNITALFKLFASRNIGRVLAQPQVVVTSGNEGKIQVGQDFSIKTKDYAGNTTDRFVSTGTILQVTPFVIENQGKNPVILLKAHVERSQAYPDAVSTIIKKSEANSLVQLYDGEETLIAGLYANEKTNLRKGVPVLRDLPWYALGLRYLFGYDYYEDTQKELIIIIKASVFPEVYARQSRDSGASQVRSTLEERLQHYRFEEQPDPGEIDWPGTGKKNTTTPAAPVTGPNSSQLTPSRKQKSESGSLESPSLEIRNGTVQNVRDDLLIISWESGCNTADLLRQTVTIVRQDGGKMMPVGKAEVLRAKSQQTVARRVSARGIAELPVRTGDQAVYRNPAYTSLGATR